MAFESAKNYFYNIISYFRIDVYNEKELSTASLLVESVNISREGSSVGS